MSQDKNQKKKTPTCPPIPPEFLEWLQFKFKRPAYSWNEDPRRMDFKNGEQNVVNAVIHEYNEQLRRIRTPKK